MSVQTLSRTVHLSDGSVLPVGTRYQILEVLGPEAAQADQDDAGCVVLLVDSGRRVFLSRSELGGRRREKRDRTPVLARGNGSLRRARDMVARQTAELVEYLNKEGVAPATEPLFRVRTHYR